MRRVLLPAWSGVLFRRQEAYGQHEGAQESLRNVSRGAVLNGPPLLLCRLAGGTAEGQEPPCPGELTGSASWVTAWELWPGGGLVASRVEGPEAAGDEVRTVPSWYPQTHASQPQSEGGWWHSQWGGSSWSGPMPLPLRSLPVRSSSQPQAG